MTMRGGGLITSQNATAPKLVNVCLRNELMATPRVVDEPAFRETAPVEDYPMRLLRYGLGKQLRLPAMHVRGDA